MGLENYFVHAASYVDEGAKIGRGTKIWHFSHVLSGAVIGKNCSMGQNVCISGKVVIGDNVKIQNNVSVYDGVCIEDDVFLGPSCVLTNVTNPRSEISRKTLYEKTTIKKGATIGANATIVCGITIGRYAFVAAGAVVTKDIPDYTMVQGVPAKSAGWISRHGHRLEEKDAKGVYTCPESGLRYREISNKKLICLDLEENMGLPKEMRTGKMDYGHYKRIQKKADGL
jgi:UDP-2-acetamido-3-amino-2,3-dideoxy-glucuronate N-acetyltransferase